jgi:hypothetical protein
MIFKNWDNASSPLWQPKTGMCWRESGQKWTIGLTRAVWHGVPTLSVCKITYQNFESFPNYWCISRDCRLTGYFIINVWKCYLLFELPCMSSKCGWGRIYSKGSCWLLNSRLRTDGNERSPKLRVGLSYWEEDQNLNHSTVSCWTHL